MKIQMCFPIWQGITLNTPGCTPTWDILCPPHPSLSLNTTSRQVCEDQIEMSWPLGFFSITRHSPKATPPSKVTPHTLPRTRTAHLDQGPRSLCEAASLFLVSPHSRTTLLPVPWSYFSLSGWEVVAVLLKS